MNLLKSALVALEEETATATPTAISETQIPEDKSAMVVMSGPLSNIYAKALNIAYAKNDPLSGNPETSASSSVAAESQAIDFYFAAQAKRAEEEGTAKVTDGSGDTGQVFGYGTREKPVQQQEVIEVVKQLASTGMPGDFVFVEGAMAPTDQSPLGGQTFGMVEMDKSVAIEGYTIIVHLKRNTNV